MKYGIRLYSKHTGEGIVLGSTFKTTEELNEWAEKNVCTRCNRYEIEYVHDGYLWMDKHHGFVDPESMKIIRDKEQSRSRYER